jgi:hypothetical protein
MLFITPCDRAAPWQTKKNCTAGHRKCGHRRFCPTRNDKGLVQRLFWTIPCICSRRLDFCSQFFSSGPTTAEFVQQHKIPLICSTRNVEVYLRDEFSKTGRRRGVGLVSKIMADQFLKSACNQRSKEFSSSLPGLQEEGWIITNLEFAARRDQVRAQLIMKIIDGIARRDVQDITATCCFRYRQHKFGLWSSKSAAQPLNARRVYNMGSA